jgi:hypothetical protein
MATTTMTIDSVVRDRIDAAAAKRGITAGSFVALLLEGWLREERFDAIRQAMEQATHDAVDPSSGADADPGAEPVITTGVETGIAAG